MGLRLAVAAAIESSYRDGINASDAAAERAKIVAWLDRYAELQETEDRKITLRNAARLIESGAHDSLGERDGGKS